MTMYHDIPQHEIPLVIRREVGRLEAEVARLSKENAALRQLLRDARDHVPWDVLKRIDAALGASRAEQTFDGEKR